MAEYELCINLWYFVDIDNQLVPAVAARGYYLQGSDEEKTEQLQALAGKDFLLARWSPVPEQYSTRICNYDTGESLNLTRAVMVHDVDMLGLDLFEEVIQQVEDSDGDDILTGTPPNAVAVPEPLLFVITAVCKDEEERLVAITL